MEGCVHYKVGESVADTFWLSSQKCTSSNVLLNMDGCCLCPVKYERIKFLVIALKNAVEVYAWAPKPYHKFMAFKVIELCSSLPDQSNQ